MCADSCGYASGSDSEVGEDSEGGRPAATGEDQGQIGKLEEAFSKHRDLGAARRRS